MNPNPDDEGRLEPAEIGTGELASLRASSRADRSRSSQRLARALRRARRQVGARDLMTLGLVRVWSGLIAILAGVFALLSPGYRRASLRRARGRA